MASEELEWERETKLGLKFVQTCLKLRGFLGQETSGVKAGRDLGKARWLVTLP